MEFPGQRLEAEAYIRDEQMFCEPCRVGGLKNKANRQCPGCKKYFCSACIQNHHCVLSVLNATEKLSLMSLDRGDVEKCMKHDNEPIKFYCVTHKLVGCSDCITLEHITCKTEYLKDLAQAFQNLDTFQNLATIQEILESYKKEYEETIQKNEDEMKLMKERAREKIRQLRTDINTFLDIAENNMLYQVEKFATENTNLQSKLEEDIQTLTSKVEEVKQKLNPQMYKGNALFINAVSCKSKLDDIEKLHAQIKQKCILNTFEFVRDEHIFETFQSALKFGRVEIYPIHTAERKPIEFVAGMRVRRGPDWKYGNQDGEGPGTVTACYAGGIASVRWDKGISSSFYRIGRENVFDLEILNSTKFYYNALFSRMAVRTSADFVVGTRVRRGPDWKWGNQDGGEPGTVAGIVQGAGNCFGWAIVNWDTGFQQCYRIGQENAYDLEVLT